MIRSSPLARHKFNCAVSHEHESSVGVCSEIRDAERDCVVVVTFEEEGHPAVLCEAQIGVRRAAWVEHLALGPRASSVARDVQAIVGALVGGISKVCEAAIRITEDGTLAVMVRQGSGRGPVGCPCGAPVTSLMISWISK